MKLTVKPVSQIEKIKGRRSPLHRPTQEIKVKNGYNRRDQSWRNE